MMKRWWTNGGNNEDGNHEEEVLVAMQTPENFMVILEMDIDTEADYDTVDDFPPDVSVVVPFASLSHFTHVLSINGIPYRVEPMS